MYNVFPGLIYKKKICPDESSVFEYFSNTLENPGVSKQYIESRLFCIAIDANLEVKCNNGKTPYYI